MTNKNRNTLKLPTKNCCYKLRETKQNTKGAFFKICFDLKKEEENHLSKKNAYFIEGKIMHIELKTSTHRHTYIQIEKLKRVTEFENN